MRAIEDSLADVATRILLETESRPHGFYPAEFARVQEIAIAVVSSALDLLIACDLVENIKGRVVATEVGSILASRFGLCDEANPGIDFPAFAVSSLGQPRLI